MEKTRLILYFRGFASFCILWFRLFNVTRPGLFESPGGGGGGGHHIIMKIDT